MDIERTTAVNKAEEGSGDLQAVVDAARRGESGAADLLARALSPEVGRRVRHKVGPRAARWVDCEALSNGILDELTRHVLAHDEDVNLRVLKSWVIVTIDRRCMDAARSCARMNGESALPVSRMDLLTRSGTDGPLRKLERQELWEKVREHMASMEPNQQEILRLRVLEAWTFPQIGTHLGIGPTAAQRRYEKVVVQLRRRMGA